MRNRAKCRLCLDVIESFHENDYVACGCDEIAVSGGQVKYYTFAKNWENFIRVGEEDKEIKVKVVDEDTRTDEVGIEIHNRGTDNFDSGNLQRTDAIPGVDSGFSVERLDREEQLKMLDLMIKQIEELPEPAMRTYVNHYDLYSFMLLVHSLFRSS